jgi:hypothetical protein
MVYNAQRATNIIQEAEKGLTLLPGVIIACFALMITLGKFVVLMYGA